MSHKPPCLGSMPFEILLEIVRHVLFGAPDEPPQDPTVDLHKRFWVGGGHGLPLSATPTLLRVVPLLRASRRLAAAVRSIVSADPRSGDGELDIMLVTRTGMLPTWTRLPPAAEVAPRRLHYGIITATIHIFERPPGGMDGDFSRPSFVLSLGDPIIPTSGTFTLYHLLETLLMRGPLGFTRPFARRRSWSWPLEDEQIGFGRPVSAAIDDEGDDCRFTFRRLVLDLRSPPPGRFAAGVATAEDPAFKMLAGLKVYWRTEMFSSAEHWHTDSWALPADLHDPDVAGQPDPETATAAELQHQSATNDERRPRRDLGLVATDMIGSFMHFTLADLLSWFPQINYGMCLYEGILEAVEFRVNGEFRAILNVTEQTMRTKTPSFLSDSIDDVRERQLRFDRWKAWVLERRRLCLARRDDAPRRRPVRRIWEG